MQIDRLLRKDYKAEGDLANFLKYHMDHSSFYRKGTEIFDVFKKQTKVSPDTCNTEVKESKS